MSSSYDAKKKDFEFREYEILCKTELLNAEWRSLYEEQKRFELEYMEQEGTLPLNVIQSLREILHIIGRMIHSEDCTSADIRLIDEAPSDELEHYEIQTFGTFVGDIYPKACLHYDVHIRTTNEHVQKIVQAMLYTNSELAEREMASRKLWRKDKDGNEILILEY
jgi:hypothetical protein